MYYVPFICLFNDMSMIKSNFVVLIKSDLDGQQTGLGPKHFSKA